MEANPASLPSAKLRERWSLRDLIAASTLFLASSAVVLWQNAHLTILWDLSYVLDSSFRISVGQLPYRDFPFAHAPLTFLIQAAIIRLFGRVFFHHVVYSALVGGLGTVLAWRIVLNTLRARLVHSWAVALILAAPLTVLGAYSILPFPSYDCDCAFSILVAISLLQRLPQDSTSRLRWNRSLLHPIAAGAALAIPLFFKQNIGLPFLLAALAGTALLLAASLLRIPRHSPASSEARRFGSLLAGAFTALLGAGLVIHLTVGLGNYFHWTIQFAAQRRLPGFQTMLGIYAEPSLLWWIPCISLGLVLLRGRLACIFWARLAALGLLAAPFLWTLVALTLADDADDRADSLLALWPLLLLLSGALTLVNLRRGLSLRGLLPLVALAAIHGALLSQQLWGSTYAIWPLLVVLLAEMVAFLASFDRASYAASGNLNSLRIAPALAAILSVTLLICGSLYTCSEERLSYVQLPDGPMLHPASPALRGMSLSGPYLPEFEELLQFASANIPNSDGLILLPGEDPFYFATGRVPQFPVLLFDPATDPYSPDQLVEQARARNIRWLVVKRDLQIREDPTPEREATLKALQAVFVPCRNLSGYDVYRRP